MGTLHEDLCTGCGTTNGYWHSLQNSFKITQFVYISCSCSSQIYDVCVTIINKHYDGNTQYSNKSFLGFLRKSYIITHAAYMGMYRTTLLQRAL
jgi:hypothetical protein